MTHTLDLDHLAVSNHLLSLSGQIAEEAARWAEQGPRDVLEAAARHLATLGRYALTRGDLAVLDAYTQAGTITLARARSLRLLIESLDPKDKP